MNFVVRPAVPEDALDIATVRVHCWRETYTFLSSELLGSMDPAVREESFRDMIELELGAFVVTEVDGEIRGFASSGPPAAADAPRDLELAMIYQLASMHGSGSGQALLDAAIGDAPAFLWTAELNPRAHAFYRRNGFVADGAREVRADWENLAELRMVR
ncbi:MAG: GNAT family N-acetyltransferase [Salinibacterium sp.]|nr:GNAT family N-acetyltransferase [Salinibacterium sp.]